MKITITIETDNAAFERAPMFEVARILDSAAARLKREGPPDEGDSYKLRDVNGNTVGRVTVED